MSTNGSLAPAAPSKAPATQDVSSIAGKPAVQASEVGWLFVPQYYTFLNQNPGRLHCFYTKKSTLVHGTEQEDGSPCFGQQEIHDKITSLGFQDCKVFVSNVDSQSSAAGGILIQVLGEMSNKGGPWRKFAQTFFLAEQPNGYFVLNDIFRYLKEDDEMEEEATEIDAALTNEIDQAERDGTEIQGTNKVDISAVAQPGATPSVRPIAASAEATSDGTLPIPAATITDNSAAPVEEKKEEEEKKEAPAPAPVEETEAPAKEAAPAKEEVATPKAAEAAPAAAAASTKPAAAAPATNGSAAPSAPAAAAAAPASAPAPAPAVPAAPKTWANLAASNVKGWGSTASEAKGVSSTRPAVTSAPAAKPSVSASPSAAAAGASSASRQSGGSGNSAFAAAQTQNHAGVFIKNVIVDKMPAEGLQAALEARFGPMKECHIIPSRACAFGEFASVEAARKAIVMSLRISDGGEGGVPVGNEGWTVTVEEKRKPGERPAPRNTTTGAGGQGGQQGAERGSGSSRGGTGSGRGDYRGRGRGGAAGRGRGGAAAGGASA